MNDICNYLIEISGQVDIGDINAMGPLDITIECAGDAVTKFSVCSDQAGLIGLMRHLHGFGFVLLSIKRAEINTGEK